MLKSANLLIHITTHNFAIHFGRVLHTNSHLAVGCLDSDDPSPEVQ